MSKTISIRLDKSLQNRLDSLSRRTGISRSDIVRKALKRQLDLLAFEKHRGTALPFAQARGFLTDEDVFSEVS